MTALRRAAGIADSEEFSDDRRHQRDLSLLVERVLRYLGIARRTRDAALAIQAELG
jgi:hypothetical protein